jgi:F-type H+-transporting ATPase subunit gamma
MATLKQIRRRIRSVESTKQITKAMQMVAAAKLRKAQAQAEAARPYAETMERALANLSGAARSLSHPLFAEREVRRVFLAVVASDKGLCGAFNANVMRRQRQRHAPG